MSDYLYQNLNDAIIPLLCFCLPGIVMILHGLRTIKNQRTVSVGVNSHFRWKKPVILKGVDALKDGK
jgi:hypothetical protein